MIELRASRLYWHTGVGWYSVFFTIGLWLSIPLWSGLGRWIVLVFMGLWILFLIYRLYRWNGTKWRRIHCRAMLVYAHTSGREAGSAAAEKRHFELFTACQEMAYAMSDPVNLQTVDEMLDHIYENNGGFYVQILEKSLRTLYPQAPEETIDKILYHASEQKFSPHMTVTGLILLRHGPDEAAKHIIALMKGEIT